MSAAPGGNVPRAHDSAGSLLVWVERDLCQGAELCVDAAGAVFGTDDNYVSFVKVSDGAAPAGDPEHAAAVPAEHEEGVRQAARECPAQCIRLVE